MILQLISNDIRRSRRCWLPDKAEFVCYYVTIVRYETLAPSLSRMSYSPLINKQDSIRRSIDVLLAEAAHSSRLPECLKDSTLQAALWVIARKETEFFLFSYSWTDDYLAPLAPSAIPESRHKWWYPSSLSPFLSFSLFCFFFLSPGSIIRSLRVLLWNTGQNIGLNRFRSMSQHCASAKASLNCDLIHV